MTNFTRMWRSGGSEIRERYDLSPRVRGASMWSMRLVSWPTSLAALLMRSMAAMAMAATAARLRAAVRA